MADRDGRRRCDLDWSLRYFFNWMRTIGIYPKTQQSSIACQVLTFILRYGIWIMFVTVNALQLVFIFHYEPNSFSGSLTQFSNNLIESSNWIVHNIGSHTWILFFIIGGKKWEKLYNSLTEMRNYSVSAKSTWTLEKLTLTGIFYIILSVRI